MPGHLRHDMRRGPEPVEPDAGGIAGHAQRPVADQPGAQQRGGFRVAERASDREAVARVDHHVIGIAAVQRISGESRLLAEVFPPCAAKPAIPAGPAQPGHADAVADGEALRRRACGLHPPDDLVAGHQRQRRVRQVSVDHVQVGAAIRRRALIRTRTWPGPGSGTARSCRSSGAPAAVKTMARMSSRPLPAAMGGNYPPKLCQGPRTRVDVDQIVQPEARRGIATRILRYCIFCSDGTGPLPPGSSQWMARR